MGGPLGASFVVPVRDEGASLPLLVEEMGRALDALGGGEMVVVDDGSADGSAAWLAEASAREPRLRALRLERPSGQSAALAAGFAAARGAVVVTLDGDLQNDPADALRLVAALERADVACGVRTGRKDGSWRRFTSGVANLALRRLLRDGATDTGCGLKAFRAAALLRLPRFNGWHRFLPALACREGLRVAFVPVGHRPRRHGRSHYGTLDRLARGLVDLAGVLWLVRRRLPPPEEAREIRPAPGPGVQ